MPAKKKKAPQSLTSKLREQKNLIKFYYDENQQLAYQLKSANKKIEQLNEFEKFIMLKREAYSQLEIKCKEAEYQKQNLVRELVGILNKQQLEAAELCKYPPERYAIEWFKILKEEQGNIERKLRNGAL